MSDLDSFHDHNKFNDPINLFTCSEPGANGTSEPGDPIQVDNPFEDTLSVQNLLTGPDLNAQVDLNTFITSSLNSIIDLNSDTQYITTTPNLTTFSNNVETDDLKVNNVYNKAGSTFIDMTDATDINISCTDLTLNGDNILTDVTGTSNPMTANLDGGTFEITGLNNIDSIAYSENGLAGELIKRKATNSFYAGLGAAPVLTATDCVLIGDNAGSTITSGVRNIGIGTDVLSKSTTGNSNTCIGYQSLLASGTHTGSNNTCLGSLSGSKLDFSSSFNTIIGSFNAQGVIGDSDRNTLIGYGTCNFPANTLLRSTCVGDSSQCKPGGTNSSVFGSFAAGDKDNQVCLGSDEVTEIINTGNGVCDIGSSTHKFKNGYFGGGLTFTHPFGEMYRNVALLDNTWSGVAFHKALFTSTTSNADNVLFTHTTNRLTYTGTMEKIMHTAVTFSISPSSNTNSVFEVCVFKNGVIVPGAIVDISTVISDVSVGNALHSAIRMTTNDYIEVWIARLSGTADATVTQMNMFAGAMGNGF